MISLLPNFVLFPNGWNKFSFRYHHLLTMSIHLRPSLQHPILILLISRPNVPRLGTILFNLIIDTFALRHPPFMRGNTFEFLFNVILTLNEVTTFLALEVECATFPTPWGYGRVGLGEESFGFFIAVSEGGEFPSFELCVYICG